MAATERDVIEMIRKNFNGLDMQVKAAIDDAITPEAIFAIHMLIGPQVADFIESKQGELRQKYGRGQSGMGPNGAQMGPPGTGPEGM